MFNLKDKISKRIHPWPLIKYDMRKSWRGSRKRELAAKYGDPIDCHGADHVHFYATLACDKDCSFCINKILSDGKVVKFSVRHVEYAMAEVLNRMHNVKEIVINGGEPFLWPQLSDFLNLLDGHNITVFTALPEFAINAVKEIDAGTNNIIFKISYHPNEGYEPLNIFVDRLKQIPEGILWNPHVIKTPGTSGRVYSDGFRKYGIYSTTEELIQPDYSNVEMRQVRCKPNEHIIAPDFKVYPCLVHMLKKEGGIPVQDYEFSYKWMKCGYYPKCAPCIGFQEIQYDKT